MSCMPLPFQSLPPEELTSHKGYTRWEMLQDIHIAPTGVVLTPQGEALSLTQVTAPPRFTAPCRLPEGATRGTYYPLTDSSGIPQPGPMTRISETPKTSSNLMPPSGSISLD